MPVGYISRRSFLRCRSRLPIAVVPRRRRERAATADPMRLPGVEVEAAPVAEVRAAAPVEAAAAAATGHPRTAARAAAAARATGETAAAAPPYAYRWTVAPNAPSP